MQFGGAYRDDVVALDEVAVDLEAQLNGEREQLAGVGRGDRHVDRVLGRMTRTAVLGRERVRSDQTWVWRKLHLSGDLKGTLEGWGGQLRHRCP